MRIAIDARPLTERKAGIGYFIDNLLRFMIKNDRKNEYYLFSDRKICFDYDAPNIHKIEDSESRLKKTPWFLFRVTKLIKKYNIDAVWGTQHVLPFNVPKKVKKILTMHDVVFYEMPETMSTYNKILMRLLVPNSVKSADVIICVSNSTKEGVHKYLKRYTSDDKVKVIYSAADEINLTDEQEVDFYKRYENMPFIKNKNYLLYVGTIEPRKNIGILLKAYEKIRGNSDLKLVLGGKIGWKCEDIMDAIKNHKYKEDIFYLDYVSNTDKNLLMKNAFAFIFPSLYEGFGIPVIEAMQLGTVTLASANSSLNELIEKNELKFDAKNSEELADKILNLHSNVEQYDDCRDYCVKRAKCFSWEKSSMEYIKEIDKL